MYIYTYTYNDNRKRKKSGGNKKTKYIDGWIEFMDKKIARSVAESLNKTIIGIYAYIVFYFIYCILLFILYYIYTLQA